MSTGDQFKRSLDKKWVMRFTTTHPRGDNCDGVVMSIKKTFIVLCSERDFEFESIVVLPRKVITGYKDEENWDIWNAILRRNGQLEKLTIPEWLGQCETIPDVLCEMKQRDIWPVLEIVFHNRTEKGKDSALFIGPIVDVGDEEFQLCCYDAEGVWEKTYTLEFGEIFKIEFEDKYSRYFNEYMRNCGAPPPL